MPFIGLGKGFVTFGTLSHRVLQMALDCDFVSQKSLEEDLGCEGYSASHISVTLRNLTRHKFLYRVGSDKMPGAQRRHALFALRPRYAYFSKLSGASSSAAKSKRSREKKKVKVSSVFDFRGKIKL